MTLILNHQLKQEQLISNDWHNMIQVHAYMCMKSDASHESTLGVQYISYIASNVNTQHVPSSILLYCHAYGSSQLSRWKTGSPLDRIQGAQDHVETCVLGKHPLLGKHPCTAFQGATVAASIILIPVKHPKSRAMFKCPWALTWDTTVYIFHHI